MHSGAHSPRLNILQATDPFGLRIIMTFQQNMTNLSRQDFYNTNQGFLCLNLTGVQAQHCHKITLKI